MGIKDRAGIQTGEMNVLTNTQVNLEVSWKLNEHFVFLIYEIHYV